MAIRLAESAKEQRMHKSHARRLPFLPGCGEGFFECSLRETVPNTTKLNRFHLLEFSDNTGLRRCSAERHRPGSSETRLERPWPEIQALTESPADDE